MSKQNVEDKSNTNSPNSNYTQTLDKSQTHTFSAVANITALNGNQNVYIPCNYAVREVIVSCNYSLTSTTIDAFYITCNMPCFALDGAIIAGLNGNMSVTTSGGTAVVASGGFAANKIHFILRQPMMLQGNWQWQLRQLNGSTLTAANIILDFEMIS